MKVIDRQPKYEYLLKVWGGFFNKHNIYLHKIKKFEYLWFDSKEEREIVLNSLQGIAKNINDYHKSQGHVQDCCLVHHKSEGYLTRRKQVIKAICLDKSKLVETRNNLGYGFYSDKELSKPESVDYMKEYKYDIYGDLDDNHILLYSELILE